MFYKCCFACGILTKKHDHWFSIEITVSLKGTNQRQPNLLVIMTWIINMPWIMILPCSNMKCTEISIFYLYIECRHYLPIMEIQNHWIGKWPPMVLTAPHTISSSHLLLMSLHWEVTKKRNYCIRIYHTEYWNKVKTYIVELEKKQHNKCTFQNLFA